jgi:hypothetical protein
MELFLAVLRDWDSEVRRKLLEYMIAFSVCRGSHFSRYDRFSFKECASWPTAQIRGQSASGLVRRILVDRTV